MKFDVIGGLADANLIENGAFLHLLSPATGEPLYRDEAKTIPCRAKVRSIRSKAYASVDFKIQQSAIAAARRAKNQDRDAVIKDAVEAERPKKFAVLCIGLENCTSEQPGFVALDEASAVAMAGDVAMEWLVSQIFQFAQEDANYGPDVGNDGGPGAQTQPGPLKPSEKLPVEGSKAE